jgi:hypothetical protein
MKSLFTAAFAIVAMASVSTTETNTFADRVAFEASVAGLVTEDFETFNGVGDFHAGTVDIGPFTIQSNISQIGRGTFQTGVEADGLTFNGSVYGDAVVATGSPLTFTFDEAIFAFGIDLDEFGDMPDPSTIGILGETFEPDVLAFGGGGLTTGDDSKPYFFGVTSDIGFTTVTFAASGDGFGFDNVSFSSVAPVPLPAPLAMLAFSVLGLFVYRKRQAI